MTAMMGRGREDPGPDRIRTKRVSEAAAPDDGTRVLVMRLWPRGIPKRKVDQWLKGLGTPLDLIRQWKAGTTPWATIASGYRKHLRSAEARADLQILIKLARRGRVTLLCTCPDEARCHRGILKGVLALAVKRG